MSLVECPSPPEKGGSGDTPASWSRVWANPRPLAIGSASYYAQEHGLTLDFYAESSKRAATNLISLKGDSEISKGRGLTSYSHLTQCTIPAASISDPWFDTEPSIQYCHQLLSALDDPCLHRMHVSEPRHLAAKEVTCEIPTLRSDNNLDLLDLAHNIFIRRAVQLAETSIPLAESDVPGDDGLRFPCWSDQLTKHFDNHLPKEAIQDGEVFQLSEDTSLYGVSNVGKPGREEIWELIDTEFTVYKHNRVRTCHSPSRRRATSLTMLSQTEKRYPLLSCLRSSLTTSLSRIVMPA